MAVGVKSKHFGCFWKSMFLVALGYPEAPSKRKIEHMKRFYDSLGFVIPCKFCRDFIRGVLMKKYPLNYSSRRALMKSIYIWKDQVNKKLAKQELSLDPSKRITKPSPSFDKIEKKYLRLQATSCSKSVGKCL